MLSASQRPGTVPDAFLEGDHTDDNKENWHLSAVRKNSMNGACHLPQVCKLTANLGVIPTFQRKKVKPLRIYTTRK